MDGATARQYIQEHDRQARRLNRTHVTDLRTQLKAQLRVKGREIIHGGPVSRDELINALLELQYPDIAQARSDYVNSMLLCRLPIARTVLPQR